MINILEASTDAFYIKIMRFEGFLGVQIHSWNAMFREPCSPLHQGDEQPDTELFLRAVPFILRYLLK